MTKDFISISPRIPKQSKPVIVLGAQRSGGTLVMKCLASHPSVIAYLTEPLNPNSQFRKLNNNPKAIADVLLHQGHYDVGVLRLTYDMFGANMKQYIKQRKVTVIHVIRDNVLRNQISLTINHFARIGKAKTTSHTYGERKNWEKIYIDPDLYVSKAMRLRKRQTGVVSELAALPNDIITVRYTDFVGQDGSTATHDTIPVTTSIRLCERLGIPIRTLSPVGLKKLNNLPLKALIDNWEDVKRAILRSPLADLLEDEKPWKFVDGKWEFIPDENISDDRSVATPT